jgi:formylglycine-generating enzyme
MFSSPICKAALSIACVAALYCSAALPDDVSSGKASVRAFVGTKAGQLLDDNSLSTQFVWIPPGKFSMGSPRAEKGHIDDEGPVHVTLTHGFWLSKYEVTQHEWQTAMQTTPWSSGDHVKEGNDYPATYVNWNESMKFCQKLTEIERQSGRLPTGWKYTLPTEAQWEYACRAGTTTRFSFGDKDADLDEYAWFRKNALDAGKKFAHQVGQKKANPWGLCDMHGNVWEWCLDCYSPKLPGGTDPGVSVGGKLLTGKPGGAEGQLVEVEVRTDGRVNRGGCWGIAVRGCRSAMRNGDPPDSRDESLGFRVAAVPSDK